jgi:hypothetical protein
MFLYRSFILNLNKKYSLLWLNLLDLHRPFKVPYMWHVSVIQSSQGQYMNGKLTSCSAGSLTLMTSCRVSNRLSFIRVVSRSTWIFCSVTELLPPLPETHNILVHSMEQYLPCAEDGQYYIYDMQLPSSSCCRIRCVRLRCVQSF